MSTPKEVDNGNQLTIEYVGNYLNDKALILEQVCKKLTEKWNEHNMELEFKLSTKAIHYNKKIRMTVKVESEYKGKNTIFYSRQDSMSEIMFRYRDDLKQTIQDFILSVMGDFMERGMESLRREAINDYRERLNLSDKQRDNFLLDYPLRSDDLYPAEEV